MVSLRSATGLAGNGIYNVFQYYVMIRRFLEWHKSDGWRQFRQAHPVNRRHDNGTGLSAGYKPNRCNSPEGRRQSGLMPASAVMRAGASEVEAFLFPFAQSYALKILYNIELWLYVGYEVDRRITLFGRYCG